MLLYAISVYKGFHGKALLLEIAGQTYNIDIAEKHLKTGKEGKNNMASPCLPALYSTPSTFLGPSLYVDLCININGGGVEKYSGNLTNAESQPK